MTKEELFRMCEADKRAVQAKATTHPNWDMGAKITLDSATMMNKGLEVSLALLFAPSMWTITICTMASLVKKVVTINERRNRLLFGSMYMLGILIDIRELGINWRDRLHLFVLFVATLLKVRRRGNWERKIINLQTHFGA